MARRVFVALGVLATLSVVVFGADYMVRVKEMDDLLAATSDSETAMQWHLSRLRLLGDRVDSGALSGQALLDELSKEGQTTRSKVAVAGAAVEDVAVMPWHSALRRAQVRYLAHVAAWTESMETLAGDPEAWLRKGDDGSIRATFAVATAAYANAVPSPDLFQQAGQVEQVFD